MMSTRGYDIGGGEKEKIKNRLFLLWKHSKAKTQCSKLKKVKHCSYRSIANNIIQDKKIVVNQNTHPQPLKGLSTIKIL